VTARGETTDATAALAEFAEAAGLEFSEGGDLPRQGGLLTRDKLEVLATARGKLPGGEIGTLALLAYEYRSNDRTHRKELTTAVIEVPESIGFAPYLSDRGARAHQGGGGFHVDEFEVTADVKVLADEGIDHAWLHELFSPALGDWIARSPADFSWELANGVLAASLDGHRVRGADLTRLCEDACHLARAVRQESLEEVDAGSAERTAAKSRPDPGRELRERLLAMVEFERPPANVVEARPVYHDVVVRHYTTYAAALFLTLVYTVGVNILGAGIFGLLLNLPNKLLSVAIFEALVLVIVGFLTLRHEINSRAEKLAREAFWREYARERGLADTDPRTFAATHARAGLPGAPVRVLTGSFGGRSGALMITGEGLKRGDSIALVGGPTGPLASAPFEVSAPGASAAALDRYTEQLATELRG